MLGLAIIGLISFIQSCCKVRGLFSYHLYRLPALLIRFPRAAQTLDFGGFVGAILKRFPFMASRRELLCEYNYILLTLPLSEMILERLHAAVPWRNRTSLGAGRRKNNNCSSIRHQTGLIIPRSWWALFSFFPFMYLFIYLFLLLILCIGTTCALRFNVLWPIAWSVVCMFSLPVR